MRYRWMIGLAFAILLLFTPLSSGDWLSSQHDFQNTNSTDESGPEPPLKALWNPEKLRIGGDWLAPIVHNGIAYLIRSDFSGGKYPPVMMAVNITNGKILWKNENMSVGASYGFYLDGNIYVSNIFEIICINATTGKIVWEKEMGKNESFSKNLIYKNNRLYVTIFKWNKTWNETVLLSMDAKTGREINSVKIKGIDHPLYYHFYIAMWRDFLYLYNERESIYAADIYDGNLIWKYNGVGDTRVRLNEHSPIVVGEGMIYVPMRLYPGSGGICAINATTGKVVWERVTDEKFEDFQYKFAYSARYHLIVRLNSTGYVMAIDSRDGHVLWIANSSYDNIVTGTMDSTPVIANNYIYVYGWGGNPDFLTSENAWQGYIIRIYTIADGNVKYQLKEGVFGGYLSSLDFPDIVVSNGKVIIPDEYLYIYVHKEPENWRDVGILPYFGISVVAISVVITLAFIARKRR